MHQLGNNFFLGCSRLHLHYAKDCNFFQSAILALWVGDKVQNLHFVLRGLGVSVPFDMQFSVPTVSPLCGPTPQNCHGKLWKSNHCKWLSPQRIFPNPRKKLPPAPWKRPLTPPATYSGRYPFSVPVIPVCLIYEYSSVSAFPTMLSIIWARAIFSIWAPVICFLAIVAATFSET